MSTSTILTSGFIPREPEEISAEWLFEVINQVRPTNFNVNSPVRELSLKGKAQYS